MKRILLFTFLSTLAFARQTSATSTFDLDETKWRAERRASLTSEKGWLTLVGLSWLHNGDNMVPLPVKPAMDTNIRLQANGVTTLQPNKSLKIGGKTVTAPVVLKNDTDPAGPTIVTMGTLSFQVIKRSDTAGDRYGVRMKDTRSEARTKFKGLDYFPAAERFRVEARFEPYNLPKKIAITNVLGMVSEEVTPGVLLFNIDGRDYKLEPILEQGETDLFIIFKDLTSAKETYGAARYLYAHPAGADGKTIIDFNHAYNPPCAFTPYATCPLPPQQNRLPIRIEAGEKKYAGGH